MKKLKLLLVDDDDDDASFSPLNSVDMMSSLVGVDFGGSVVVWYRLLLFVVA